MNTVYKYSLNLGETTLQLPANAKFLMAGAQGDNLCAWFQVNTTQDQPYQNRVFTIYGTGHEIFDIEQEAHLTSFIDGPFVWHLYEYTGPQ